MASSNVLMLVLAAALLSAIASVALGWFLNSRLGRASLAAARAEAEELRKEGIRKAESEKKAAMLSAKDEWYRTKKQLEKAEEEVKQGLEKGKKEVEKGLEGGNFVRVQIAGRVAECGRLKGGVRHGEPPTVGGASSTRRACEPGRCSADSREQQQLRGT